MQPVEPVAPAAQNTDTFDGGKFNPDELPQELQPAWHQLQAEWTRKTQQLAEERKQYEALGDVESIQQAVELYSRIIDPNSWGQLHQELTAAMEEHGLSPAAAQAVATEEVVRQQQSAASQLNADEIDDPELGALVRQINDQQQAITALQTERESERTALAAEYERQAFLGELQRQENAIRATHPDWDDDTIQAVYEMSSFHGGNLGEAASRIESIKARERELYLAQKGMVQESTSRLVPPASAGTQSQQVHEPQTILDAEAGAEEFLRAQLAHYAG